MSDDLSFNVEVRGVQDLDKLANTVDKLTGVLNSSRGSGKSLEEMRRILIGMKGQSSVFHEMKSAIEELNSAAKTLKSSFTGQISQLNKTLKSEMAELRAVVSTAGAGLGKAAGDSIALSVKDAEVRVQRSFRSMAAKAKAEATLMYEQISNMNPKARFKDMNVLVDLKEAGASLSAYHNLQVAAFKKARDADLEGFQQMVKLKVASEKEAKDRVAGLQKKALADDLAGFQQVVKLKVASEKEARDRVAGLQKKALADDLAGFQQMLKLKVAAEKAAADARLAYEKSINNAIAANRLASDRQMFSNFEERLGIGRKPMARSNFSFQDAPALVVDPNGRKAAEAKNLATSWDRLNISGNNLHSMARGLASGFNLLWLTWGNIAPLLAGAALSNAFVQTVKQGMQVAHTMEVIGALGEATAKDVSLLNEELHRLAKQGPFGPLEIAEAMKTLSLAGLKANEVLAVTQDVLNFSVAGTTDLKTAADTLVAVSTAYGLGAAGFGRVSDVISSAAASSMASIESFSGAMRQATVVNSQYGVSLEDTAVGIAALSNIGIQASAAGTALRNMYADLSGRSGKVAEILKELGLEIRDTTTGGFKPMIEVVAELNKKLLEMNPIAAKNTIQQIFGERGGKPIVELLRLIQTEAKGMGAGLSSELARIRKEIDESYGFAAISAARLSQTLENQFKGIGSALKNSMYSAYQEVEPIMRVFASTAKEAFSSPEFVSGLTELVRLMASVVTVLVKFTAFLVEHSAATLALVGAYALWRVGLGITMSMQAKAAAALVADTAATEANTISKAKNAAVSRAGALANLTSLGKVGAVLAVVAGAWMLYEYWMSKSGDTAKKAAEDHSNGIIAALDTEAKKLERINELNLQGLTIGEAKKRQAAEAANRERLQPEEDFLAEAKAREAKVRQRLADLPAVTPQTNLTARAMVEKRLNAELQEASSAVDASIIRIGSQMQAMERVREENRKITEAEKRELAEQMKASSALFKGLEDPPDFSSGKGGSKYDPRGAIENENILKNLERRLNDETSLIKASYDDQRQILENAFKNEIINRGEHQAQLLFLTASNEAQNIEAIKKGMEEYASVYQTKYEEINAKRLASPKGSQAYKDYEAALKSMKEEQVTFEQLQTSKIEKIQSDSLMRRKLAEQDYYGEIAKLKKADAEFWGKDTRETERQKALKELEDSYANVNTSIFSIAEAEKAQAIETKKATDTYLEKNEAIKEQIKLEKQRLQALREALFFSNLMSGDKDNPVSSELLSAITSREGAIADLSELLANSTAEALKRGAEKGSEAFQAVMRQKKDQMVSGISDSIVTALFEGGKAGRKKLRDLIVNELKKPVVLVVNAVVNTLLGGVAHALGFGGGAAGAVSTGGGLLGGIGNALSATSTGASIWGGMTSGTGFWGGVGSTLGVHGSAGAAGIAMEGGAGVGAAAAPGGFMSGIGAAMPWIAGGLALLAAFGAFRSKKVVGGGIMGELGGEDALRDYSLVRRGGSLFSGPSYSVNDLGESSQSKAIQDAYKAMRQNTVDMAKSLGLDTSKIENYRTGLGTQIHPDTGARTGIDLKDLTPEEAQAKIAEALRTANNEMAQQILGTWTTTTEEVTRTVQERVGDPDNWDWVSREVTDTITRTTYAASEYAKEGEEAIDTLTRLATSLGTVNAVFDSLGYTLYEGSLAGADLASKLVDAFGSIENFTNATSAYYNDYYSEQEKQANLIRAVTAQLSKYNLTLPTSKEEYRRLVEAQDLSTDKGREMYAMLIQLAPAFAAAADAAAAVAGDRRNKALQALEAAIAKEKELLAERIQQQQQTISTLTGLFDFLDRSVKELYSEVRSTAQSLAAVGTSSITQMLASALSGGPLPDQKQLEEAYSSARSQLNIDNYSSVTDLERDRLVLAGRLSQLRDLAEDQLTDAQRTLKELEEQNEKLDETLEYWREQVEIANGTYEATLSVADAIDALRKAMFPDVVANTNPTTAPPSFVIGGGNTEPTSSGPRGAGKDASGRYVVESYFGSYGSSYAAVNDENQARLEALQEVYDRISSGGGSIADAFRSMFDAGATLTDIGALGSFSYADLVEAARRAGVNSYDVGTDYVPYDQLAFVHKGEKIIPAKDNKDNGGEMSESRVLEILSSELAKMNENLALQLLEAVRISKAVNGNPEQPTPVVLT